MAKINVGAMYEKRALSPNDDIFTLNFGFYSTTVRHSAIPETIENVHISPYGILSISKGEYGFTTLTYRDSDNNICYCFYAPSLTPTWKLA